MSDLWLWLPGADDDDLWLVDDPENRLSLTTTATLSFDAQVIAAPVVMPPIGAGGRQIIPSFPTPPKPVRRQAGVKVFAAAALDLDAEVIVGSYSSDEMLGLILEEDLVEFV